MQDKIKNYLNSPRIQELRDVRNIGLYIFALIVLAITWSGIKTVQNNYQLQKQIAEIKQQNYVLYLQNGNTNLQNQYYQTDEYLELAARQDFGLAAPGETVLLVPKSVAMKYVNPALVANANQSAAANTAGEPTGVAKNLEDWRDFLLGRKLFN